MDIDDVAVLSPHTEPLEIDDAPFHPDSTPSRHHSNPAASVAVIDPCDRFRQCVASCVSASTRFVVEGYTSVDEFLDHRKSPAPRIVMFCSRAGKHSATLGEISRLLNRNPSWQVVVLADAEDRGLLVDFLRLGARGVIPPSYPVKAVTEVLQTVLAGGTFAPFEDFPAGPPNSARRLMPGNGGLTNREDQVVSLLRSGKPNKQIAYELGLSIGTVKIHLHNIMLKLGAHNRIQVLAYQGLIATPQPAVSYPALSAAADTGSIAYLIHGAAAGADNPA
jgi:DNA-binding NarL/FixJ family response regulator